MTPAAGVAAQLPGLGFGHFPDVAGTLGQAFASGGGVVGVGALAEVGSGLGLGVGLREQEG